MGKNDNSMVNRWKSDKSINASNISQCSLCMNKGYKSTCKAFPDRIPDDILYNRVIHNKPLDNDNGVIFIPKDEKYKGVKFEPMF